jgi:outer membrane protein TolC
MRIVVLLLAVLLTGAATPSVQASTLTVAFERACERTPEIQALIARRAVVDARQNAAGALLPGGPWTTVMHRTDALTHDRGTRDYVAEFMVPIWLRGERGASLAAALTEGERLDAEVAFRRLEVAKRIRDAYWMAVEARDKATIAERRRTTAAALLQDVRGQVRTGQVGVMETRLAEADVSDAEAASAGRRAELKQGVIGFRVLTGLDPPPAYRERDARSATPASHPRIVLRHSALRKAFAEQDLTWIMDRERPEFGAFAQNMTDTSAEPNVTTLGVRLKIPFAYDAVNQPKRAAAAAEVVAAREELSLAEREVAGEADQAQVRLDGARQQLAALEARRGSLAVVAQLAQEGQRAGQVALSELIRSRLQLYEADLARAIARVALERARSDRNQALGLEP